LLQELDPEMSLSEGHRADMLLDLAGLDKGERCMIQASIGNVRDFNKIADALIIQHPRIHIRNDPTRQKWREGDSRGKGKRKGKGGGKGKFRPFVNHKRHERNPFGFAGLYAEEDDEGHAAYLGAEEDEEEPYTDPAHWYEDEDEAADETAYNYWEESPADSEWNKFSAYISDQWSQKYDADATSETALEAAELECVACMFDTLGPNCCEDADACSSFIQQGAAAFVFAKKGKGKGKGKASIRSVLLILR